MKNVEQMQDKRAQAQYPQPKGGGIFKGQGQGGVFFHGRGQVICYNCGQLGHFSIYFSNPTLTCSYCK